MTVRMMIGSPRPTVRPAATAPVLLSLLSPAPSSPTFGVSDDITSILLAAAEVVVAVVVRSNELEGGISELEVLVVLIVTVVLAFMVIETVALAVMLGVIVALVQLHTGLLSPPSPPIPLPLPLKLSVTFIVLFDMFKHIIEQSNEVVLLFMSVLSEFEVFATDNLLREHT